MSTAAKSKARSGAPDAHDRAGPPSIADAVLGSGSPGKRTNLTFGIVAALMLHVCVFSVAARQRPLPAVRPPKAPDTELELEPVPPPPPPPQALPKPEPPPPAAAPRSAPSAAARRAPVASAPAQAARLIAQEPDPAAPVDLSATTFVSGTASAYAGGVTTSTGTSTHAVTQLAPPAAPSPLPRRVLPVLSRAVTLAEGEWQCAWPEEAQAQDIDEQTVTLRVLVAADGSARSVELLADPGHGFGAAARSCALSTRFTPALDAAGQPTQAKSPPIRVRFTR